jgi:prophage maintenance system killer protein
LAFLWLNDVEVVTDPDELAELVLGVATGSVGKADVAVFLAEHSVDVAR